MSGRHVLVVGFAAWLVAACATPAAQGPAPDGGVAAAQAQETDAAHTVASVLATPVLVVAKGLVCAASLVIAAPVAALLTFTERAYAVRKRQDLDESLTRNCGPPWVFP